MKKPFKILTASLIIPVFVMAALACCCFNAAEAANAAPPCHAAADTDERNAASNPDSDCDCAYKDNILANSSTFAGMADDGGRLNIPLKLSFSRLDIPLSALFQWPQGPPGKKFTPVPLYIQNSNFRI